MTHSAAAYSRTGTIPAPAPDHDTQWQEHAVTITFAAPGGNGEAIAASAATALRDTIADHGGGCPEVTDAPRRWLDHTPSALVRCDGDDAFAIPEPAAEPTRLAILDWLALQGVETLTDVLQAQFDVLADGRASQTSDGPLQKTLRSFVDQSQQPCLVDELRDLRFIGDTARICAHDALGWYSINHLQVDWQSVIDRWEDMAESARVWPVADGARDTVRVALYDESGQPSVYEVAFNPPQGIRRSRS